MAERTTCRGCVARGIHAATHPCPACTCDDGRQTVAESSSAARGADGLQPAARQASLRERLQAGEANVRVATGDKAALGGLQGRS
eukprot:14186307-Alexandrium_andersonii.AAC.1